MSAEALATFGAAARELIGSHNVNGVCDLLASEESHRIALLTVRALIITPGEGLGLRPRQQAIYGLVVRGFLLPEAAESLGLSTYAAEYVLRETCRRLGVTGVTGLRRHWHGRLVEAATSVQL